MGPENLEIKAGAILGHTAGAGVVNVNEPEVAALRVAGRGVPHRDLAKRYIKRNNLSVGKICAASL